MASKYKEFKRIEYDNGQELRVYRDFFKEKEVLSIRRFYEKDGEWLPGKGVTFHFEDIDDIIEGLQSMQATLDEPEVKDAESEA